MMLFSILIANYNNGHFFTDCYNSIIHQTYKNWEVIIVDDASTDNSIDLINGLIAGDSRFNLYQNDKNGGCGYTKRRCVELATGEICGFLDPDDLLEPNALEVMVNLHLQNKQASLIYSNYFKADENLKNRKKCPSHALKSDFLTTLEGWVSHFATFKRSLYLKTQGIDAKFKRAVDQDLYYKMEEVGSLLYEEKYLYIYRIHDGGISVNDNELAAFSWKLVAVIDACNRRNIDFEKIISSKLHNKFIYQNRNPLRVGNFILAPVRKLKKMFNLYL